MLLMIIISFILGFCLGIIMNRTAYDKGYLDAWEKFRIEEELYNDRRTIEE